MRQRLSSEPDRYRGRRRAPSPPRSRYAAVMTTAFVGAGVVAFGAGAGMPDAKAVSDSALAELRMGPEDADLAARAAVADRASRNIDRSGEGGGLATSIEQPAPDIWVLPLRDYSFSSPYGMRWGKLHGGVDLAVPERTVYHAVHAGTVEFAGSYGGYGNAIIIDHGNGVKTLYGHSYSLLVEKGQHVKAGDPIGLVGNTGYSFGPHLHLEVHVNDQPKDPVPWLRAQGVDINLKLDPFCSSETDC